MIDPRGWLMDRLYRTLEPGERDAVQGDFAELGLSPTQQTRDLLGLVARRQAALWNNWQPWLALLGIAVPLGLLLTGSSYALLARELWTEWCYGVRYETGLTATGDCIVFLCQALAIILASWLCGFVLASLSRRTLRITAVFLYLTWILILVRGIVLTFDNGLSPLWTILQILPSVCLFVLPSAWGMRQSIRCGTLGFRRTILFTAAIITTDALALWTGSWWRDALVTWSQGTWHGPTYDWQKPLFILTLTNWPLLYLIATAMRQPPRTKCVAHV